MQVSGNPPGSNLNLTLGVISLVLSLYNMSMMQTSLSVEEYYEVHIILVFECLSIYSQIYKDNAGQWSGKWPRQPILVLYTQMKITKDASSHFRSCKYQPIHWVGCWARGVSQRCILRKLLVQYWIIPQLLQQQQQRNHHSLNYSEFRQLPWWDSKKGENVDHTQGVAK